MDVYAVLGVLVMDGQTDRRTDICDSRVAFATDNSHFYFLLEFNFFKHSAKSFFDLVLFGLPCVPLNCS